MSIYVIVQEDQRATNTARTSVHISKYASVLSFPTLLIYIAKHSLGRRHQRPQRNLLALGNVPQILQIRRRPIPMGLVQIVHGQGPIDRRGHRLGGDGRRGARVRVQHLPHPPHAVDVGVVAPKDGIAGAHVKVAAGVAARGVVAAAVDAELGGRVGALHGALKGADGGLREEGADRGVVVPAVQDLVGEVAFEAAGVVLVRVGGVVGGGAVHDEEGVGAEVHGHVGEGA